jgi:anti-anti-sigma regulatory factor
VNAHVSAQRRGGKLLLKGVNERVKTLFELTRVTGVLNFTE